MIPRPPRPARKGFTLLELLVSLALFLLLAGVSAWMISAAQRVWGRASAQAEQFRTARQALDLIAERVAQATLNPYWQVAYDDNGQPLRYERASELRFRSGPAATLLPGVTAGGSVGSAIFFQSPTGYRSDGSGEPGEALNTWGYFVEYGSDAGYRPPFLTPAGVPPAHRYRLVELLDPSDQLTLFGHSSGHPDYDGVEWFTEPAAKPGHKRVLAENVIAFVVLPRLSRLEDAAGFDLAPALAYDSTERRPQARINPRHQLPPVLEIAAVVIDERSAARVEWGTTPPDLGVDFTALFHEADQMEADLAAVRDALTRRGLDARIFRQSVPLVSARWSHEQTN